MALLTWYNEQENQNTFFIIETPEGSLDLAYEQNVADMYKEFKSYWPFNNNNVKFKSFKFPPQSI